MRFPFYIPKQMQKLILIAMPIGLIAVIVGAVMLFSDKGEDPTTDPSFTYNPIPTTSQFGSSSTTNPGSSTAGNDNASSSMVSATYVLTTDSAKANIQAAWASTTRFEFTTKNGTGNNTGATVSNPYANVVLPTNQNVSLPNVNTQQAPSTTWSTIPQNNNPQSSTSKKFTTSQTTTEEPTTTEKPKPVAVDIIIASTYVDSNGIFHVAIDSEGWGGTIKSNTAKIPVSIDGTQMEKPVTIKIVSTKDSDGYQSVQLDLTEYEVDLSSSTISFEIPSGFLKNISGTKYNNPLYVNN